MSKKELLKYLLENNTNIGVTEIIIGMIVAVLLSFFVYFVYKKTYSGVMYSKNFNATLVLITVITTMVMMIIGSNLALSLGMVGALSIIRFRTAVKEPKDAAYIFWAIAIGIACGSAIYSVAIIGSLVIALIMFFLSKNILDDTSYLLIVHGNENVDIDALTAAVKDNTTKMLLKMKNVTSKSYDVTFEVKFATGEDLELISSVQKVNGVSAVNVVTYNGEIAG